MTRATPRIVAMPPPPPAFVYDAVVLAGGHSRRMGRDKATLPHPHDGRPLLLRQLDLLAQLPSPPQTRWVSARIGQELPSLPATVRRVDDDGQAGPLGGIVAAWDASNVPYLLTIAVDLPLLNADTLVAMLTACDPGAQSGAVARVGDTCQPLVAIYPRAAHAPFATALAAGQLSLRRLLAAEPLATLCPPLDFINDTPFRNWNTPNDL